MRSTRRRVHRADANATALVELARKLGILVYPIGRPVDLLVFVGGKWYPCEVKALKGKYTEWQAEFFTETLDKRAPILTWRTEADVISAANCITRAA